HAARLEPGRVERNRRRLEGRRAHVDGDASVVLEARLDHAAHRLDADRALVGQALLAHEAHEAARAGAALLDRPAVGVEDAVAEVDALAARGLDQQDLVGADAVVPIGQRTPLRRLEAHRLPHAVDHDEVVAGAVHLREAQFHAAIIADTDSARRAAWS